MVPDLWVMRHGETEWNVVRRMQGRSDSALTPRGRAQAARQAELVAGIDAARLASPQGRARESARIVFGGRPYATDPRLAEICVGDWTGRIADELRAEAPAAFAGAPLGWYDHAPGGEGFAGLRARVRAFLADLDRPAIVITHGVTLRVIRAELTGEDLHADVHFDQGAVHLIRAGRATVLT